MRTTLTRSTLALLVVAAMPACIQPAARQEPAPATATQAHAGMHANHTERHAMHHGGHSAAEAGKGHSMKTPCPLHLTTLDLTPAQAEAMTAVRATRKAAMKDLLASIDARGGAATDADRATMERDMKSAVAAARGLLTDAQRITFDAAVAAHAAEKAEHKAAGTHDCLECCRSCEQHAAHGVAGGHTPRD